MARTIGLGVKTDNKGDNVAALKEQISKAEQELANAKERESELLKQINLLTEELEELKKDKKDIKEPEEPKKDKKDK